MCVYLTAPGPRPGMAASRGATRDRQGSKRSRSTRAYRVATRNLRGPRQPATSVSPR